MDFEFKKLIISGIYEFCKVYRVVDIHGSFISEFPIDTNEPIPFDTDLMHYKNWELFDTRMDVRDSDTISAITSTFWTCNCKHRFVRHISDPFCDKCKCHVLTSKARLPFVNLDDNESGSKDQYCYLN